MKKGMYKGSKSLLWDNRKDYGYEDAIRELRFKKNNITQLVINIGDKEISYSTKIVIQWFMNQKFTCGQQFTHRISSKFPDKITTVSRKMPYKFRHWVSRLMIIYPNGDIKYFRPGVHIENTAMGTSQAKSDYNDLASQWKYTPEDLPKPKPVEELLSSLLVQDLCKAYDIDIEYADMLDAYIQHKIQITRLPQDEVVYGWFVELGIAPAFSNIDQAADSIVDDDVVTYIGKEDILDDVEDYIDTIQ